MDDLLELIRSQCSELAPRPTELRPKLSPLPHIKAVLFDIYGTMLMSASGDIGSDSGDHKQQVFAELTARYGLRLRGSAADATTAFERAIRTDHAQHRDQGVDYPEVEIREIWQQTLAEVSENVDAAVPSLDRFAIDFETRVNPTWPMPGVVETLESLRASGRRLGIVSNAQFFTPLLFPALLERSLETLGFDASLGYFSYEHRRAKPSEHLYRLAAAELERRGIRPASVLYVGNDMLNDVAAASAVGFRTALFAGDERSLRLRIGDERVAGVEADVIVTALTQLLQVCVSS